MSLTSRCWLYRQPHLRRIDRGGLHPVILDNFNSHPAVLELKTDHRSGLWLRNSDVLDTPWVGDMLARYNIAAVLHFAGDKAVGESVAQLPAATATTLRAVSLLEARFQAAGRWCFQAAPRSMAIRYQCPSPSFPRSPHNPYGHQARDRGHFVGGAGVRPVRQLGVLRYFNPVGAHTSARIGEDPSGIQPDAVRHAGRLASGLPERNR
jgi:UDP-glucose 4-epimerase